MIFQVSGRYLAAFTLVLWLNSPFYSIGQDIRQLISAEELRFYTTEELSAATFGFPAQNGATAFKILYTTFDLEGIVDTASGLLLIPDVGGVGLPLLAVQHGTTSHPFVPSNLDPISSLQGNVFAGQGYITFIPDLLGLGESRGFHPVLHAESEASAAVDMLYVVRDLLPDLNANWNGLLFLSGYSQGAHTSAALHRELQQNHTSEFTIQAAAYLSGPYLPSLIINDLLDPNFTTCCPAIFLNIFLAYQEVYGNIYSDIFKVLKPEFVPIADLFFSEEYRNGEINNDTINVRIAGVSLSEGGNFLLRELFVETFIDDLANNPNNTLRAALEDNDVTDFAPIAPTLIAYCEGDELVDAENSVQALIDFNENEGNVQGQILGTDVSHNDCFLPAMLATIEFFSPLTTSIEKYLNEGTSVRVYPNPASDLLIISMNLNQLAGVQFEMLDLMGRMIYQEEAGRVGRGHQEWNLKLNELNESELTQGIYFLRVRIEDQWYQHSIVIE